MIVLHEVFCYCKSPHVCNRAHRCYVKSMRVYVGMYVCMIIISPLLLTHWLRLAQDVCLCLCCAYSLHVCLPGPSWHSEVRSAHRCYVKSMRVYVGMYDCHIAVAFHSLLASFDVCMCLWCAYSLHVCLPGPSWHSEVRSDFGAM